MLCHSIDGKLFVLLPGAVGFQSKHFATSGVSALTEILGEERDFHLRYRGNRGLFTANSFELSLCNNKLLTKLLPTGSLLSAPMSLNVKLSHCKVLKCIRIIQLFKFKWAPT